MNQRRSIQALNQQMNATELIKKYNDVRKSYAIVANNMFHDILNHPDQYEFILEKQDAVQEALDPENKLEAQLLSDLLFYPHLKDGICMTQIYLQEHRLEEEREMLFAMLESKLSLFQFKGRDESTGIVQLYDLVNQEEISIVDKTFGIGRKEPFYMIGRYMQFNDIFFLTGISYCFVMNSTTNKYMKKLINDFRYKKSSDVLVKVHHYYKNNPNHI